jgi:hypothetical protein
MKKILGICGDSFMSSDLENRKDGAYGKHFTEILGKMLNCEVVTYARGGLSNQAIRLQIDEIIKHKPHHVIIGTTTPDRIEIPINDLSVDEIWDKWSKHEFRVSKGIYNIVYDGFENQSSQHKGFKEITPTMYSQTLSTLMNVYEEQIWVSSKHHLTKETSDAVRGYFHYLYDMEWKKQQDTWIISEGLYKLMSLGIDFNVITPQIDGEYFTYCKDKVIDYKHELNPWVYYEPNVPCHNAFHISDESSVILAKLWYEKLKEKFLNII